MVDAERGVLLRVADRFDGEDLEVRQLASLTFDQPHAPEVFTFVPPSGERLLPVPDDQEVTIEEAAAVADFTVYVPAGWPGGGTSQVFYWPGWQRSGLPGAEVRLQILGSDQAIVIRECAAFSCSHDEWDWQHVRHDGQDLLVSSSEESGTQIRLRKGDTSIEVWAPCARPLPAEGASDQRKGNLAPPATDPDAIVALAAGLGPASATVRHRGAVTPQSRSPAAEHIADLVTAPPRAPNRGGEAPRSIQTSARCSRAYFAVDGFVR